MGWQDAPIVGAQGESSGSWRDAPVVSAKSKVSPEDQKAIDDFVVGDTFGDRLNVGAGKAMVDLYRGAKQLFGIGDQAALQAEIDEAKKLDKPIMGTAGGVVGNVVGNIAATALPTMGVARAAAAVPGLMSLVDALSAARPIATAAGLGAVTGAATGALEPVATGESRGKNVVTNAAFGAAGGAIPGVVAKIVGGAKLAPDAKLLMDEGVRLTPGQAMGGMTKRVEDSLTSVVGAGDMVRRAQQRSLDDFNVAAINRALAPIGQKMDRAKAAVGREGIAVAESKIGDAYDKALNKIQIVRFDQAFDDDMAKLADMVPALGRENADQFGQILRTRLLDKMTPARTLSAESMKEAESELGRFARALKSSPDPMKRDLGDAVREVQAALRGAVERSAGPDALADLRAANTAWANFVRVVDAAGRQGATEGVFTAPQLSAAVRAKDASMGKRAFAKGDALMQDLSDAGKAVLPSSVPDSGTATRLITNVLGGGGLHMLGLTPEALALSAAAALPYTGAGSKITLGMLARRPEFARELAAAIEQGAPAGALAAALAAPSFTGP